MPYTQQDLIEEALGLSGRLQAGQDANPEDVAYVQKLIPALISQIGIEGVVYVADTDQIDDQYFLPLANRLALEVGPRFGVAAVDDPSKQVANQALRRLAATTTIVEPIRADYF